MVCWLLLVEESICASSLCSFSSLVHSVSVGEFLTELIYSEIVIFSTTDKVMRFLNIVFTNYVSIILVIFWLIIFLRCFSLVHEIIDQIFDLLVVHIFNVNAQVDLLAINY